MKTAFEICATLDRARFPLAATLLNERDVAINSNEDNASSILIDNNEESSDRLAKLQSKIAALGLKTGNATPATNATSGKKYTTEDLKALAERVKAALRASQEEFGATKYSVPRKTEKYVYEGMGELEIVGLRVNRPKRATERRVSSRRSRAIEAEIAMSRPPPLDFMWPVPDSFLDILEMVLEKSGLCLEALGGVCA